jgi:hypothetical protein
LFEVQAGLVLVSRTGHYAIVQDGIRDVVVHHVAVGLPIPQLFNSLDITATKLLDPVEDSLAVGRVGPVFERRRAGTKLALGLVHSVKYI